MQRLAGCLMLICCLFSSILIFAAPPPVGHYLVRDGEQGTKRIFVELDTASIDAMAVAAVYCEQALTNVGLKSLHAGTSDGCELVLPWQEGNQLKIFLWEQGTMRPLQAISVDNDQQIWGNLAVGGGGYVTGIAVHADGTVYARTDVGGLYRWDNIGSRWMPTTDFIPHTQTNLYGIDGLAIAPANSDTIYAAAGKYDNQTPCGVLKSVDGGRNFVDTGFPGVFGGNQSARTAGECIAVDPRNDSIVMALSRDGALYISRDAAGNWERSDGYDAAAGGMGYGRILFFDRMQKSGDSTQLIYAAVPGSGLLYSEDGGITWNSCPGAPTSISRMDQDFAGTLYLAGENGIWAFDGVAFRDITPSGSIRNFSSVAVNPQTGALAAVTRKGDGGSSDYKNRVYYSADGGQNWKDRYNGATYQYHAQWAASSNRRIAASSCAVFWPDEMYPNRMLISDWYGVWRCDDIAAANPKWISIPQGIEETVGFCIACPPEGHPVFAGIADVEGFYWDAPHSYPNRYMGTGQKWQEVTSIDFCEQYPALLVRVGDNRSGSAEKGYAAYSEDGGATWTDMLYPVNKAGNQAVGGRIAVSASAPNGIPALVTTAKEVGTWYSHDLGQTWQACAGLPDKLISGIWDWSVPLAADRSAGDTFYIYHGGRFYVSRNGGAVFEKGAALPWVDNKNVRLYAMPGKAGWVWISLGDKGLYRSSDYGISFAKVEGVTETLLFCFGKSAPGQKTAAVYLYGELDGVCGIWRSIDNGASFQRIDDEKVVAGNAPNAMMGDRQRFGVVYISTNGRGIVIGEPASRMHNS